ncbi:MAG TPA: T9SS type A sorting domain-containing protein [Flavobacteriales bacterium]|nr:T9SS type A sorting domain-containing protein [Flavobacteriales bacterium]HRJ34777.1 T9SS type A sorting domain-containing protein [Flavobacteriales bacterium]
MNRKGIMRLGTGLVLGLLATSQLRAEIDPALRNASGSTTGMQQRAAGCAPATALTKLEFNNVSAIIETGGNMWQDRAQGFSAYEVPKGSRLRVMFAGALWLGGKDFNDQLKVAAVTFRQGNDFWPGPLLTDGTAEVDQATCLYYDKFFVTLRQDIVTFVAYTECIQSGAPNCGDLFPGYTVPRSILEWPGNNSAAGYDFNLAPYKDVNNDGVYNPGDGDYPWYDIKKELACGNDRTVTLYGDQNFWWVFNDKGNIHTETGADPIGMEIRAQAFAFSTNDEVNDMTFYNYELYNRGTQTLFNTYFGQWCDPDVGFSEDDFVGCDVQRGLGYAYNGDAFDDAGQGQSGYGANPPAVGIDFFQGPFQDNDNIDNPLTTNISDAIDSLGIPYKGIGIGYGDGVVDNERFGMRKFLYYFRSDQTNVNAQKEPNNANDFYRYLQGIWLDGTPFYFGGTAHQSSAGAQANGLVRCDFMFPGNSDPLLFGTLGVPVANASSWTEFNEGNTPADRRFMQSAGPFTLTPGQKNNITVGVVYARATTGNSYASVDKLRLADDKAQALFDNCFKILDAPDAPDLTIQELDRGVVLYLTNPNSSNNVGEAYVEKDPFIVLPFVLENGDSTATYTDAKRDSLSSYRFQGYKIYQLKDATVSSSDLTDPDKARIVAQCDIKDGVGRLVNFIKDEDLNYDVPTMMVEGADKGIFHSLYLENDAFTQKRLVNHKTYYYMAVAYAYNNYKTFDPYDATKLDGQKKPYIESRKSVTGAIRAVSAIPHIPVPETAGTNQVAKYGDGPEITRIEGAQNGSLFLDLTAESENFIVQNFKMATPTYQAGRGPISVKVIDPLNVKPGSFILEFLPDATGGLVASNWRLKAAQAMTINGTTYAINDVVVSSSSTIRINNEQLIPELGISIAIEQYKYTTISGSQQYTEPISGEIFFADSSKRWLVGVPDGEGSGPQNWLRAGTQYVACDAGAYPDPQNDPCNYNDYQGLDNTESYENLAGGTWGPYRLCASSINSGGVEFPAATAVGSGYAGTVGTLGSAASLHTLPNVDIVFTSDMSKWTRCPVLEMQESAALSQGGRTKQKMRAAQSVDKFGNPDGTGTGMGWFPGYAIDVATGERLNMAFGEDSWLGVDNGRDMKFNPTNRLYSNLGDPIFGGKHYVYVFTNQDREIPFADRMPAYDGGAYIQTKLSSGTSANELRVWRSCVWVGMPMLASGFTFSDPRNIPTEARVKLRVKRMYEAYSTNNAEYLPDTTTATNGWRPKYRFSLDNLATQTYLTTDEIKDSILSLINIVPNPYYAVSDYETGRLDTRVKVTNLPERATVRIYNVSGQLIRTYTKDSPLTSLDWDLKNQAGIPIASGIYIVHVEVPEVGEKILKWFGAMRPPDLQNF